MKNKSDSDIIRFMKLLRNDNINAINYSEVKETKLIRTSDYGVTVKGNWREQLIIMKHIPNDLKYQGNEALREFVQRLTKINHPNILKFLGDSIDFETKSQFLVLEYSGNRNLHDYLSENKNLKWSQKIKISKDIACGLEYLHNIKIVHRNLNTKTIFMNNEKVQILNPVFLELNTDTSSSALLQEGILIFTDPELLSDPNSQFKKSSDIYSLGMVMRSISCGNPPFENHTNKTTLLLSLNDIHENPINDTSHIYLDLSLKCRKLNSKERPSAQDVYAQLAQLETTLQNSKNIDEQKPNGEIFVL
ncbi:kinase-like domain-containing protein [Gigaspora rosea]|uniref:Kinase-like domain-containing protein n=1 Tax=Gigaspora rosea TaxID=44941 RepID=A0A397VZP2_9GLOM|nr:kinase-like domain-containing protein [Gigaspora rosea]